MDNPKRQLAIILVVSLAVAAYSFFNPPEASETPAEGSADTSAPLASGLEDTPLAAAAPPAEEVVARSAQERVFTITTEHAEAVFSNLHTGLKSLRLTEERFLDDGQSHELVTTDKERFAPFRFAIDGIDIPADAVWEGEQLSPTAIRFTWVGDGGIRIVRRIEAGRGPYQLWSTLRIVNGDTGERHARARFYTHQYVTSDDESGGFIGRPSPLMASGVCRYGEGELERETGETLTEDPIGFGADVTFSGIHNTYFGNVLVDGEGHAERCVLAAGKRGCNGDECHGTLLQAELRYAAEDLAAGEELQLRNMIYLGPTDRHTLRAAGHYLPEVIDLGWFSFIANFLSDGLNLIQSFVGNWGIAIILLTLLVKLLFFPLTMRSFEAMGKMRQLKPKIDALNEKYADNPELKGQAVMALYRQEKVNPAAGCLPSLLQMPVWFALYRSLSTNIELYHAPFALWTDLSAPDPYYILPGFVALLMHLQQRLTPTTMDPAQAKMMMYLMPIMIGSFMLFLPAGLCVYMVTNSMLTIAQQRFIYSKLDQGAPATGAPDDEGDDGDDEDNNDDSDAPSEAPLTASRDSSRRKSVRSKNSNKRQRRG